MTLDARHLDHSLGFALARALVGARKVFAKHIHESSSLRPVEFSLLMLLLGNEDVTPKELCRALSVPAPNLTPIVDRMIKCGWIRRAPSERDGRSQHIQLTNKGRKLAERVHRTSLAMENEWLAPLRRTERKTLLSLLRRVSG